MKKFEEIKFNLGELKGISAKNIEEHLKLYAGYVKNANLILEHIEEFSKPARPHESSGAGGDSEKYAYELGELQRRFAFEFDGMRNHEYYFESLSGGPKNMSDQSELEAVIQKEFGSFGEWLARFKAIALTRGIGWAMLYYDSKTNRFLNQWVDEQHLGHLVSTLPILCLDMWEHAYVYDYPTSEKKKYIEAFFDNLNWTIIEENFKKAV
jgi:Fe-Mn family superoxide dismutase